MRAGLQFVFAILQYAEPFYRVSARQRVGQLLIRGEELGLRHFRKSNVKGIVKGAARRACDLEGQIEKGSRGNGREILRLHALQCSRGLGGRTSARTSRPPKHIANLSPEEVRDDNLYLLACIANKQVMSSVSEWLIGWRKQPLGSHACIHHKLIQRALSSRSISSVEGNDRRDRFLE